MRRVLATLALILLLPGLAQAGPMIWGKAEGGMSQAEIKALYPRAEPGTRDTIGRVEAVELLRIPAHDFMGEPFTVRFFFDGRALHMVMLTHEDPGRTSLDSIGKYVDGFSSDYGEPQTVDTLGGIDRPDLTYRQFAWSGSDRDVVIVWVRAGEGEPIMNINFTPP